MRIEIGAALARVWLIGIALAAILAWGDGVSVDLERRFEAPSVAHWLGTDELGRDLLSRLAEGARYTIVISGGATLLAVAIGTVLGSGAAWFQGGLNKLIVLLIDLMWTLPVAIIASLIIATVGATPASLLLAIAGLNWVGCARVVRVEVARILSSDSIRAARGFGFNPGQTLFLHVRPQIRQTWLVVLGLGAVETLALETGLAFLGLRLPPPTATWGALLADGLSYLSTAWWIATLPALAIVLTIASVRRLLLPASPSLREA